MISSLVRSGFLLMLAGVLAAGCAPTRRAPVIERAPEARPAPPRSVAAKPVVARPSFYTVKKGDTLYSIALDHGLDYRELAAWNNVEPSRISVGQQLRLTPPATAVTTAPLRAAPGAIEARPLEGALPAAPGSGVKTQPKAVRVPYTDEAYAQLASVNPDAGPAAKPGPQPGQKPEAVRGEDDLDWMWPATGRVIGTFNDGNNLKGVTIAGKLGQPVVASAAGKVIFSGTGIRGFGKLIVIKHNKTFLSVYAHNSALLVKEGETVAKGQKIAEMGNTDADQVELHFEIRRLGKPVDPMTLLPNRS